MKIEWSEPPPSRSPRTKLDYLWEALRTKPGKWAVMRRTKKKTNASTYRINHPDFEFAARANGTVNILYARYVGKRRGRRRQGHK